MAVDKKQKRKAKREKKMKAQQQDRDRLIRREKVDEYAWQAQCAFDAQDYRKALEQALKILKLQRGNLKAYSFALHCASLVKDYETILMLWEQQYRQGTLSNYQDCLRLSSLALHQKNYPLAREVAEAIIADVNSDSPRLTGRLSKAKLKEAREILLHCKDVEKVESCNARKTATLPNLPPQTAEKDALRATENGKGIGVSPAASSSPHPEKSEDVTPEQLPELKIVFEADSSSIAEAFSRRRENDRAVLELTLKAYRLSFRTSYDQLLCLPTLRDVRSLWHQEETARKVMKDFRGRAILADEVGLGKTIEAGLILKEYVMRGLVRSVLVLAPSSLVQQWREELAGKFGMEFVSTGDPLCREDPERFWGEPFIVGSIQTARSRRHFDAVTSRFYDLVIVDEAHHMKNRNTLNWKLVNNIQKTFLLMLTATPVQNSLEELYNLVTLLRPGHLKTQKAFKERFVTRGNPADPRNREALRQLLKEVMVRNTRSVTQLQLPPRFATTVRTTPSEAEAAFYDAVGTFVAEQADARRTSLSKLALKRLLEAAGSSHAATLRMLERMGERPENGSQGRVQELISLGRRIQVSGKARKVLELLKASPEQKIIFVNYIATMEYLRDLFREHGIPYELYYGGMSASQKQAAMDAFQQGRRILLATGSGGEGHNLQFCHILLNYDLPWNPMEIEQRIGRIHRIGQEKEVQVYNFCASGSIEDRILDILDRRINMFELVVGEIDMILGRLQGEEDFSDMVYEIWVKHREKEDRERAFDALAAQLKRARSAYEKSRELDEKLFQEDFGV